MSIQLLCVSHKTADTKIRGLFAFDDDAKARIMRSEEHTSELQSH